MEEETKFVRLAVDPITRTMLNELSKATGKSMKFIVLELVQELHKKTVKDK